MSARVIVEFHVKPGMMDAALAQLKQLLGDTRCFKGCEEVTMIRSQENPDLLIALEQWEAKADYEAYFAFRVASGDLGNFGELLTRAPVPKYFDFVPV